MAALSQPVSEGVLTQIAEAIQSMQYGTVQVTVHASRVVQIEKVERVRLTPSTDHPAGATAG